jgi:hypothetical protein
VRRSWLVALAFGFTGCHRGGLPPRPDGAAVVIAPETTDDGLSTTQEVEPNDTLATAQRLPVTPSAPLAVAGDLTPRAPATKRDADFYRVDLPAPDGGVPDAHPIDAGAAPQPRLLLRADLRPAPGLAVVLDALDGAGHPIASAVGQPGEAIALPNLAARPGALTLRVRAAVTEGGAPPAATGYRLAVRLVPFDAGAEIEPNGDAAHATDLALGGEAVGYLGWRHDQDWFRLSTAGSADGSVLSADLDPVPEVSASLQLYGADGHKLTETRGRKGERVVLRNVRLPSGDAPPILYLVVRADGGFNIDARYNLRPRAELPKAGSEAEPNDDAAHAQAVTDGTVVGYLARGDVDVFRYTTDGLARLDVEVAPPERAAVRVEVLREDGALLARADSNRRSPARIAGQAIPGGPILIRVTPARGAVNADEPYRLTLSSHPDLPAAAGEAPAPKAE